MTIRRDYGDVHPGDRLYFNRPGVETYGGAVWQSPTTGDILAGDTFLTLHGEWLPASQDATLTVTVESTHRREGEHWNPAPVHRNTPNPTE